MPRWRGEAWVIKDLMMILKPLMMEPRRSIIKILSDGEKDTNEIYRELEERGIYIPRSTLYYHLSSLREAGIIDLAGYKEEKGGAPEKIWKLKVKKIGLNLVTGEIFKE